MTGTDKLGLRLSKGDQRLIEGSWSAVSILGWCVGCDREIIYLSVAHSHLLRRKWSLTFFLKVCIPLREGRDCRRVGGS